MVYVGWVTTQYHIHSATDFSQDMVRVVAVQQLDNYGRIAQSTNRQGRNSIVANLGQVLGQILGQLHYLCTTK